MVESFTGRINTDEEFKVLETEANITFTVGKVYTMQVYDSCYLKVADAEFFLDKEKLQYKAGSDDLYIKTSNLGCLIAILEEE